MKTTAIYDTILLHRQGREETPLAAKKKAKKLKKKKSSPMLMIAIPLLCSLLIIFSGVFLWLMWGEGDSRYANAVAKTLFPQRSLSGVSISDEPKELYNMQISAAVTHSERGSYQNITVDSGAVVLKNKTVLGDLTVTPKAGKGDIELCNIVVRGKIVINGGGHVTFDGVTAPVIESNSRYGTEFLVTGETAVQQLVPYGKTVINESKLADGYYGIKRITAEDSDDLKLVTLKSGTVEQTVPKSSNGKTEK